MIHDSPRPPIIVGQKVKSNHKGDSNEPPTIINFIQFTVVDTGVLELRLIF